MREIRKERQTGRNKKTQSQGRQIGEDIEKGRERDKETNTQMMQR